MGKRSNLYEIYFGPIGGHTEYDKLKNGPRGSNHSVGDPLTLAAEFEDKTEIDDLEDDEGVDVLSKVRPSMSVNRTDMGRSDPQGTSYDNIGHAFGMVAGLTERNSHSDPAVKKHAQNVDRIKKSDKGQHTTMAVPGLSPNMTYRTSKGGKATKTAGSSTTYPIIYQRPRVDMTASRYGTARAQLPRHDELDANPIFSLDDLLDRHEVSLQKHTTNVNRVRNTINEINDNFFDI